MTIGVQPGTGFALQDGYWLNGLAGGHNRIAASGIVAAGNNQATATQLPDRVQIIDIDTSVGGSGVNLPFALSGVVIMLYNNTANNVVVYPTVPNNAAGAQDTINNATSVTVNSYTAEIFFCAKAGIWAAK